MLAGMRDCDCEVDQPVDRRAHNPKAVDSSSTFATIPSRRSLRADQRGDSLVTSAPFKTNGRFCFKTRVPVKKRSVAPPIPPSIKLTNAELSAIDIRRQYEHFRKKYFKRSKLPPIEAVFVLYADPRRIRRFSRRAEGPVPVTHECRGFYMGGADPEFGLIVINAGMDWNEVRATLLHEMAHMSVEMNHNRDMGHGKIWQSEMKRLANADAFKNLW